MSWAGWDCCRIFSKFLFNWQTCSLWKILNFNERPFKLQRAVYRAWHFNAREYCLKSIFCCCFGCGGQNGQVRIILFSPSAWLNSSLTAPCKLFLDLEDWMQNSQPITFINNLINSFGFPYSLCYWPSLKVYDRDLTTSDFMGSAFVILSDLELNRYCIFTF